MKPRNPALDIIRCFALLCVISVHFFLHSGFYDLVIDGSLMFCALTLRSFFMICVPLFLLLSGYLMCNKQFTAGYYLKMIYTLTIYVMASLCCMSYLNWVQGSPFSLSVFLFGTMSFSNAPYSWYIEMYIGLFVLIPFLNILYHGLSGRNQKRWFLAVLLFLTALPTVVNIYRFGVPEWWLQPSLSEDYKQLIPSWWDNLYPLTYYFLGCYMREYPPKWKLSVHVGLLLGAIFATGLLNYYRSWGSVFVSGPWQEYSALPVVVMAVLVFIFFLKLDYSRISVFVQTVFARISQWSLGAYLVSWIFDSWFYQVLAQKVPIVKERFLWFPVITAAVFLCSVCLSAVLNLLYDFTIGPLVKWCERKWFSPAPQR